MLILFRPDRGSKSYTSQQEDILISWPYFAHDDKEEEEEEEDNGSGACLGGVIACQTYPDRERPVSFNSWKVTEHNLFQNLLSFVDRFGSLGSFVRLFVRKIQCTKP